MNEQENITHKDCKAWCHNSVGSPHPKNKVPIKEFEKPTKHPLVPYFQNCKDCRNYLNNSAKKLKNEKDKKLEEEKQKLLDIGDTSHKVCTDRNHHISGSIYPYNNVPEIKFRKYPDDPKSHHLKTCLECRTYDTEKSKKLTTFKQERAKEKEKFYCIECYIEKDLSERGKNLDGTFSSSCKDCKINKYPGRENIKTIKAKIKTEFIKKQGSCCDVCNKFFIKEPQNNPPFKELQMEIINNDKVVKINDVYIPVEEFIEKMKDEFELDILQFDHLTEKEQRERGLLKEDEIFVPKRIDVSQINSESAMRLEAQKCQLVCIKCHIIVTISREREEKYIRTGLRLKKKEYVDSLKKEGCSLCGYVDVDFLRFFDSDHIDPEMKTEHVAKMLLFDKYSYEDLVNECKKCRILCKFCHILHTRQQLNSGVIFNRSLKIEK